MGCTAGRCHLPMRCIDTPCTPAPPAFSTTAAHTPTLSRLVVRSLPEKLELYSSVGDALQHVARCDHSTKQDQTGLQHSTNPDKVWLCCCCPPDPITNLTPSHSNCTNPTQTQQSRTLHPETIPALRTQTSTAAKLQYLCHRHTTRACTSHLAQSMTPLSHHHQPRHASFTL